MQISLDMYVTAMIGLLVLCLGQYLKTKISIFEKFCIPAPVIGGLLFALVNTVFHETGTLDLVFDETLKNIFMMIFFTTIGFQADLGIIKKGGKGFLILLVLVTVMIVAQNIISIGAAKIMGISPLLAMCTGSIPMVGGHGTAAAFGPILESMGFNGATTYATAAATFGLVAGSLIGGPLAKGLITNKKLQSQGEGAKSHSEDHSLQTSAKKFIDASVLIVLATGLGSIISSLMAKTSFVFPSYIGSMLIAAILRNIAESTKKIKMPIDEINYIGNNTLSIFLGIAMITLKLWQLAELALPLIVLLLLQTVLMFFFARFVCFNCLGKDYDAAMMTAGFCGFGMGATPNALANMDSIAKKYGYSEKAFLLIPLAGALFADFINSSVLTVILNTL